VPYFAHTLLAGWLQNINASLSLYALNVITSARQDRGKTALHLVDQRRRR
jgi:hypothetical protein